MNNCKAESLKEEMKESSESNGELDVSEEEVLSRTKNMPVELEKLLHHSREYRNRFSSSSAPSVATMHSPKARRNARREAAEDEVLVRDEDRARCAYPLRFDKHPPFIKFGTMRDYQVRALNWLISLHEDSALNGILADEMGLGKTLESISLLGYLQKYRNVTKPHLVIVPLVTFGNWFREFERWCPTLRVLKFHGMKDERPAIKKDYRQNKYDVILTTYEMCNAEITFFRKINWYYIVIDEAHRIKDSNSLLSRNVRRLNSEHRLLMTGTPLQNNLRELWGLLNFLTPKYFKDCESFEEWFKIENVSDSNVLIKQLHMILRPFMLRRLKKDVEKGIPPKKETCIYTGLSKLQREIYTKILTKDIASLQGQGTRTSLLNVLMQLRKVCNHPYLFHGVEPGPPYIEGEHLAESCGKMVLLDKLLRKLKAMGSRVLLFSQMTRVLDIIEDYIIFRSYKYCRIDGSTKSFDRQEAMDRFNHPESDDFIFLLSTRAGGLGINLQTANVVILFDSDWNPQMDMQAIDRAHRIGQTKVVNVYRFITDGTVEERMLERAQQKMFLDAVVIQQGQLAEKHAKLSTKDLYQMVRFGAEEIFKADSSNVTDVDIETILKAGEARTKAQKEELKNTATEDIMQFSFDEDTQYSVYDYQGGKYKKPTDSSSDSYFPFVELPQRGATRERVNYSENAYFQGIMDQMRVAPREPKSFKFRTRPDYQFFNNKRLEELARKDYDAKVNLRELQEDQRQKRKDWARDNDRERWVKRQREKTNARERGKAGASESKDDSSLPSSSDVESSGSSKLSVPEFREQSLDELKSAAGWLTSKEEAERTRLLSEGLGDWNYTEFSSFLRASGTYGRKNIKDIAQHVPGKTPKEVRAYHKIFWARQSSLDKREQYLKRIEDGETRVARTKKFIKMLEKQVSQHRDPLQKLVLPSTCTSSKTQQTFNELEDRFLLTEAHSQGWGEWDRVRYAVRQSELFKFAHSQGFGEWDRARYAVRQSELFKFDWFLKSRTTKEIQQRVERLLHQYENEKVSGKKRKNVSITKKSKSSKPKKQKMN
eukprot:378497_1